LGRPRTAKPTPPPPHPGYHEKGETSWTDPSMQALPAPADAGALPPGWAETADADGNKYWYHENGATSWELPVAEAGLPAGWGETQDGDGNTYCAYRAAARARRAARRLTPSSPPHPKHPIFFPLPTAGYHDDGRTSWERPT
jgi:hypothetical protein